MKLNEADYLAHYGILRRSGRYPWGSGDNVVSRSMGFLDFVDSMKKQGLTEAQIAKGVDLTTTELRAIRTRARHEKKQYQIAFAESLKNKGYSNGAIAERMGLPGESSVRALLAPGAKEKNDILITTSQLLKDQVAEKGYIQVGAGVEQYLGISREKLNAALILLKEEGYEPVSVNFEQMGTGELTKVKVLGPPGTTQRDAWANRDNIQLINSWSEDGGKTRVTIQPPIGIDPDRVGIRYAEQGGLKADGVIYVRPGVKDVSLGDNVYGQVRIKVGDSHYLKGMAMYKDDLPDGVDLLFNTNKSDTGNKLDAMKELGSDPKNPFGSTLRRQILNEKGEVTSVMNLVNEEGRWNDWSNTLSSQMLSKQNPSLAKQQLDVTFERRKREYDEIMALTNPTVRKKLLQEFADSTDSAAVHLKAAALPRQATKVILPIDSIKPTQIYAPTFNDGESVVLIRYPHGGKFEIPELTVNNGNREAKKLLGNALDAVGIHHTVAEQLSGADFDGDTVLVIPNRQGLVKREPPLSQLRNFEPKLEYRKYEGMKVISEPRKNHEMGLVSNLITDMTIKGASHEELSRAVRHSMVVIDAAKHELDYKRSEADHGIRQLREKYQGSSRGGSSTLVSRKKGYDVVPEVKLRPQSEGGPIDPVTGRKVFVDSGRTRRGRDGERVPITSKVNRLSVATDAHSLSSGTPMERIYADHSNRLKGMANQARLEILATPPLKYSPSAKRAYSTEVASLEAKLSLAKRNAPLERQAQILANAEMRAKRQANPGMDPETIKKLQYQALETARARTGAGKTRIEFTPKEWEAVQAGAISNHRLEELLRNADMDSVRSLATPRQELLMTPSLTSRAQSMLNSGYTRAEVAEQLGVSTSTLDRSITGGEES